MKDKYDFSIIASSISNNHKLIIYKNGERYLSYEWPDLNSALEGIKIFVEVQNILKTYAK